MEFKESAIQFQAGKVRPVFADFDGDGQVDLFVPQSGACKVFAYRGGRFADITAQCGAIAQPMGQAVSAAAVDFNKDGRIDLIVGCLKGSNRYFRNSGQGKFIDATDEVGLSQQVFNTRGLAVADINTDGALDLLLNNEGQESTVLLGRPTPAAVGQVSLK